MPAKKSHHRRPTDTTDLIREIPELALMGAMGSGGVGQFIDEQRRAGQSELCTTAQHVSLPICCNSKDKLEAWGVQFLPPEEGNRDKLFTPAIIPEGWAIQPTDHHMYTKLVDTLGRERARIMYKADFYDRDAWIEAARRFRAYSYRHDDYDEKAQTVTRSGVVADGGVVIWRGEARNGTTRNWDLDDETKAEAVAKLAEIFPEPDDFEKAWAAATEAPVAADSRKQ